MSETIILTVIGVAGLGLATLAALAWVRGNGRGNERRHPDAGVPASASSDGEVPLARYQPMFRLLGGGDAAFLRRYPNCPQAAELWAQAQRRVVRLYLKELAKDFQALHREARIQIARSPEAPPYAMLRLFHQQAAFWRARVWIELRLSVGGAGALRINPEPLISAFEALQRELSRPGRLAQDQPA